MALERKRLEWRENWLTELKEAEHMQIAASSFSQLDWRNIKEQDRNNNNIKSSFVNLHKRFMILIPQNSPRLAS